MSLLFSSTPGTNNSLRRKKTKYSLSRQEAVTGWLFVFPILIGFSIFTFWAIIYSFIISLTSWDLLTAPEFVGMRNFIKVFKDQDFWQCMYNTIFFVVTLVHIVLVLSMAAAIAINQNGIKLVNLFKVSFYMPFVTSTIAISMVWLWNKQFRRTYNKAFY